MTNNDILTILSLLCAFFDILNLYIVIDDNRERIIGEL
jgi:hypothetical protein